MLNGARSLELGMGILVIIGVLVKISAVIEARLCVA
jgi:uncharacterized membrane protein YphA (DoxX/SURF4 family)